MELLHRLGGMKNKKIGDPMEVDYSTVSQGRSRLKEKMIKDRQLQRIVGKIGEGLSLIKM